MNEVMKKGKHKNVKIHFIYKMGKEHCKKFTKIGRFFSPLSFDYFQTWISVTEEQSTSIKAIV